MINLLRKALNLNAAAQQEFGGEIPQPVTLEASLSATGPQFQINYQGLLKDSGASEVYLHYGTDDWNEPSTVKMARSYSGNFTTTIWPQKNVIQFCFKDNANNWDNNNGNNWKAYIGLES